MGGFLDPWSYLAYLLNPWAAALVLLLLLFWGRPLGLLRRTVRGLATRFRRVLGRASGALLCAECGRRLGPGRERHAAPHHECAVCGGKWCLEAAVQGALKGRGRQPVSWSREDGGRSAFPCPACAASLEPGTFLGQAFPVYRCGSCRGYWLGRVEWVSFELNVLG